MFLSVVMTLKLYLEMEKPDVCHRVTKGDLITVLYYNLVDHKHLPDKGSLLREYYSHVSVFFKV